MNLALKVEINEPDFDEISAWAECQNFNTQQVDCLTALMFKILDGKCKMDQVTQQIVIAVYQATGKKQGMLFDPSIHLFLSRVFQQPDPLSLRHIHELRLFAESAIPRPVMKRFKQTMWATLPG